MTLPTKEEVTASLTFAKFADWLRTQSANGHYDYTNSIGCPIVQYVRATFQPNRASCSASSLTLWYGTDKVQLLKNDGDFDGTDYVAIDKTLVRWDQEKDEPYGRTYGEALQRIEILMTPVDA